MATKKVRQQSFFISYCCCCWIRDPGWINIKIRNTASFMRVKVLLYFPKSCCWCTWCCRLNCFYLRPCCGIRVVACVHAFNGISDVRHWFGVALLQASMMCGIFCCCWCLFLTLFTLLLSYCCWRPCSCCGSPLSLAFWCLLGFRLLLAFLLLLALVLLLASLLLMVVSLLLCDELSLPHYPLYWWSCDDLGELESLQEMSV